MMHDSAVLFDTAVKPQQFVSARILVTSLCCQHPLLQLMKMCQPMHVMLT